MRTKKKNCDAPSLVPAAAHRTFGHQTLASGSQAPPAEFPEAVLDALIPCLPLPEALRFAAVSKGAKHRTAQLWRPAWKSAMQQASSNVAARTVLPRLAALAGDSWDVVAQKQAIERALSALIDSPNTVNLGMQQLSQLGSCLELEAQAIYNALFRDGLSPAASSHLALAGTILYSIGRRCSDSEYGTAVVALLCASVSRRFYCSFFRGATKLAERLPADYVLPALRLVLPGVPSPKEPYDGYLSDTQLEALEALLPKLPSRQALQMLMEVRPWMKNSWTCGENIIAAVVSSLPHDLIDSTLLNDRQLKMLQDDDKFLYHFLLGASDSCIEKLSDPFLKQLLELWTQPPSSICKRLPKSRVDRICAQALRQLFLPLGRKSNRETSLTLLNRLSPHATPKVRQHISARLTKLMRNSSSQAKAKVERWHATETMAKMVTLDPPESCGDILDGLVLKMQRWSHSDLHSRLDFEYAVPLGKAIIPLLSPDQALKIWKASIALVMRRHALSRNYNLTVEPLLANLGSRLGPHHSACWSEALGHVQAEDLASHHFGVCLLSDLARGGSSEQPLTAWEAACAVRTEDGVLNSAAADNALSLLLPQLSQAGVGAALSKACIEPPTYYRRRAWTLLMDRADAATAHAGLTQLK
jgi:hypothetical protein